LEIAIEVVNFLGVVIGVYDDACFSFIGFNYHCIFLLEFVLYFLGCKFVVPKFWWLLELLLRLSFFGGQVPEWALHFGVQHSYGFLFPLIRSSIFPEVFRFGVLVRC
jgi:hypothetical protein